MMPPPARCETDVAYQKNVWWIVVAGAMGAAVGAGIFMVYAFGILGRALTSEHGWDRSVVQYCMTSFLIASGFGSVVLGRLIHRHGVRHPSIAYIVLFASAIAVLAALPASQAMFYAVFAIIGFGGAAANAMPYAVSVSAWFDRNRGLALGLVNTGAGVGAALAPQYASFLVSEYGWRAGFLGVAVLVGLVPILGFLFLVRDPPVPASRAPRPDTASPGIRWFQAPHFRGRHFWRIALCILAISVAMFGVMGLMVPMLADRGVPSTTTAAVLSAAGVSSWFGRVIVGYAMDKVFAPYVAASTFALALIGVALIGGADSTTAIMIGAALVGFTFGAEGDLVTFLTSRYFSMEQYSTVLGAVWVTWAWGGGIGTYLVGVTYSATGSYETALTVFAGVLVAAAIVVCTLGPYLYPPAKRLPLPNTSGLTHTG